MRDSDYTELQNPEAARAAHRTANAVRAQRAALERRLDLLAAQHLADLAADRPADTGAMLEAAKPAADRAEGRAVALRDLAGLDDSGYPWRRWLEPSEPGGEPEPPFRSQLAQWEELAVQRADEADNPDAYGVDAGEARWRLAQAEARILALRDLTAELQTKAAATAPNSRPRAAGGDTDA